MLCLNKYSEAIFWYVGSVIRVYWRRVCYKKKTEDFFTFSTLFDWKGSFKEGLPFFWHLNIRQLVDSKVCCTLTWMFGVIKRDKNLLLYLLEFMVVLIMDKSNGLI